MMNDQVVFLMVIAPREQKDKLVSELHDNNANYLNVIFGHGSLDGTKLATLFPFATEPRKVVITAFVRSSQVADLLMLLEEKFMFNQANTGFAFTIPIENIYH
jgi:hypothetical protein